MTTTRRRKAPQDRRVAIAQMLTHPLRVQILELLAKSERSMSPKKLSDEMELPLANVAYHIGLLRRSGFIRISRQVPRRGAVEHFYRLTPKGKELLDIIEDW